MIRRFLTLALFFSAAVLSQAQPSLPSSFQAKTIHSPAGADIFVRWGGSGPVVLLITGTRRIAIRGLHSLLTS